jgi:hypothetical protein
MVVDDNDCNQRSELCLEIEIEGRRRVGYLR